MRRHWIPAALLGTVLVVGCSDRADDTARNVDENGAPATEQPVASEEPAPAPPDTAAAPAPGAQARPTTPASRPSGASSAAPAPRPEAREVAPAPAPARPVIRMVTVPAGTALPLVLTTAVSSETAQVETPVGARVSQDVVVDGVTVIPAGSTVQGEVVDVTRAGRVQGRSRLGLRFTSVTIGDTREDLRTNPVTFEGEATRGEDATKIGAGAGVGAVIGGLLGGGSGAAKGAAIGGAAGAGAVLATRGREVELPVGSNINATTASEVELRAR